MARSCRTLRIAQTVSPAAVVAQMDVNIQQTMVQRNLSASAVQPAQASIPAAVQVPAALQIGEGGAEPAAPAPKDAAPDPQLPPAIGAAPEASQAAEPIFPQLIGTPGPADAVEDETPSTEMAGEQQEMQQQAH